MTSLINVHLNQLIPVPGLISHSSIGGGSFGNGGGSLGNGGGSGKSFSLSESLLFLEVTFSENWETFTRPVIHRFQDWAVRKLRNVIALHQGSRLRACRCYEGGGPKISKIAFVIN